jgi:hypothetical protein
VNYNADTDIDYHGGYIQDEGILVMGGTGFTLKKRQG